MSKIYFVSCVLTDVLNTKQVPFNCKMPLVFDSSEAIGYQIIQHYLKTTANAAQGSNEASSPFKPNETLICNQIVSICPIAEVSEVEHADSDTSEVGSSRLAKAIHSDRSKLPRDQMSRIAYIERSLGVNDTTPNKSRIRLIDAIAHIATDNDDSDLYDACATLMESLRVFK